MTVYTWPEKLYPSACELTPVANIRRHSSPYTGGGSAVDLLGEKWRLVLTLPDRRMVHGGSREAMFTKLRGGANLVTLWHFARPEPAGTMRGAPTVYASAAQGSQSLTIQTAPGATLKEGDLIGVSGLLLMVADDCTANGSGVLVVPLANRLRLAVGSGSAVTWFRPSAQFRLQSSIAIGYRPGAVNSVQAEFLEDWA